MASAVAEILGTPEPTACGPTVCIAAVAIAVVWSVVTLYSQAVALVFLVWRYAAKYDSNLAPSEVPEWAAVVRLLNERGKGDKATELLVRLSGPYARQVRDVALHLAPELADREQSIMRMATGLFLRLLSGLPPSNEMIAAALGAAS